MWKKVLILTLCLTMAIYTPSKAFVGVIGANALKLAVRPLVGSILVKQGIKTVEKSAMKRAEERWFSRITADQAAAIEKAAARAEPVAGKSGWLKTTIGVGMWLSGADMAFNIYDMVRTGKDVEAYTDSPIRGKDVVLGRYGLYLTRDVYQEPNSTSYWFLKSFKNPDWYYAYGATSPHSTVDAYPMPMTSYPHMHFTVMPGYLEVTVFELSSPSPVYPNADPTSYPSNRTGYKIIKVDGAGNLYDTTDTLSKVSDRGTTYDYSHPYSPPYVPNNLPDVWPNDTQGVEVQYPDPGATGDPEQTVIDNKDAITTPAPAPSPAPAPAPDPNKPPDNPPDANDWGNKFKALVTTKFPFSLPWDLAGVLGLLAADPRRPEVHVDQNFMGLPFRFDVTFEYLDSFMPFFRGFIVIGFVLFLILSTRRLLGGAQ